MIGLLFACAPKPAPAPDVVVVVVDTLRADAPHFAGNPRPTSPHLDALVATDAAWFSRAFACSSWTLPSVASILTGQYPWEHRVFREMEAEDRWGRLDPNTPTLATVFSARGYRTAAWVNNIFLAPQFRLNQGFDRYDYVGSEAQAHRGATDTVRAALDWLNEAESSAFLLIHLMEPHYDYAAPAPYGGRFGGGGPFGAERQAAWMKRIETPSAEEQARVRAAYDEEVLAVDAAVGLLIEGLRARGRWAETTFVLTADHGEELWEQGGFEHGHTTRSPVTQVPLVVHAPGVVPGRDDSLLDLSALYSFLVDGSGRLADATRGASSLSGGLALAEGRLYGPAELSAADAKRRLIVEPGGSRTELWRLDEDLHEVEALHGQAGRADTGAALRAALEQARGDLLPRTPHDPVSLASEADFERLRGLGYVE